MLEEAEVEPAEAGLLKRTQHRTVPLAAHVVACLKLRASLAPGNADQRASSVTQVSPWTQPSLGAQLSKEKLFLCTPVPPSTSSALYLRSGGPNCVCISLLPLPRGIGVLCASDPLHLVRIKANFRG